eukprot:scaffold3218_cov350-Prasinococcus_capsulatus_cf.AAC.2
MEIDLVCAWRGLHVASLLRRATNQHFPSQFSRLLVSLDGGTTWRVLASMTEPGEALVQPSIVETVSTSAAVCEGGAALDPALLAHDAQRDEASPTPTPPLPDAHPTTHRRKKPQPGQRLSCARSLLSPCICRAASRSRRTEALPSAPRTRRYAQYTYTSVSLDGGRTWYSPADLPHSAWKQLRAELTRRCARPQVGEAGHGAGEPQQGHRGRELGEWIAFGGSRSQRKQQHRRRQLGHVLAHRCGRSLAAQRSGRVAIVFTNNQRIPNYDPITIALSEDGGQTWPYIRDLVGGYHPQDQLARNAPASRASPAPCQVAAGDACGTPAERGARTGWRRRRRSSSSSSTATPRCGRASRPMTRSTWRTPSRRPPPSAAPSATSASRSSGSWRGRLLAAATPPASSKVRRRHNARGPAAARSKPALDGCRSLCRRATAWRCCGLAAPLLPSSPLACGEAEVGPASCGCRCGWCRYRALPVAGPSQRSHAGVLPPEQAASECARANDVGGAQQRGAARGSHRKHHCRSARSRARHQAPAAVAEAGAQQARAQVALSLICHPPNGVRVVPGRTTLRALA